MKTNLDRVRTFLEEARRRKLVRASILFGGGIGAVLGALDILSPLIPAIDRVFPQMVLAGILLFPIVLVLAWAFDITPDGIRLTRSEEGHLPSMATRLGAIVFVGTLSLAFGAFASKVWLGNGSGAAQGNAAEPRVVKEAPLTSIAVLYFDEISEDGSLAFVAEGITEFLTTALSQAEGLQVMSRTDAKLIRDRGLDHRTLMAEQGRGTWIEGSVQGSLDDFVVTVQVIEAATGDHLFSLELPATEPGNAVLDSLRSRMSVEIRRALGVEIWDREARSGTDNVEGLRHFQQGRQAAEDALRIVQTDKEAGMSKFAEADSLLRVAQGLDEGWAAPLVERGWVEILEGFAEEGAGDVPPQHAQRAAALGAEAVARAPGDPLALELHGVALYYVAESATNPEEIYQEAETCLKEALRIDPLRAQASYALSRIEWVRGDLVSARVSAERALNSNPFLVERRRIFFQLFQVNTDLKDFDQAAYWCAQGRQEEGARTDFLICTLFSQSSFPEVIPSPAEAWAVYDSLEMRVLPEAWKERYKPWASYQMALVFAKNQQPDSALFMMEVARQGQPTGSPYDEARIMHVLGDEEATLDLLTIHLERQPSRKAYVREDWWFESLREHPRFREITGTEQ